MAKASQAAVNYYVTKYMAKPQALDLLHVRRTLAQPVDRAFLDRVDYRRAFLDLDYSAFTAHYERDILNLDEVD